MSKELAPNVLRCTRSSSKKTAASDLICYTAVKVEPMCSKNASDGDANQNDRELTNLNRLACWAFSIRTDNIRTFSIMLPQFLLGLRLRHLEGMWVESEIRMVVKCVRMFGFYCVSIKRQSGPFSRESVYLVLNTATSSKQRPRFVVRERGREPLWWPGPSLRTRAQSIQMCRGLVSSGAS